MLKARTDRDCEAVIDWYWKSGRARTGKYALKSADWLDRLYSVRNLAGTVRSASGVTRPSAAVWGPSQTGKSTSVSRYIDANVEISGDPETDASGGGLHWPGGRPAFFLFPYASRESFHAESIVLNPFNSGLDASACLSRFTLGTLRPAEGRHHVVDPRYPVQIKMVTVRDLWMSLARGYDSQCVGPLKSGERRPPTVWTGERFQQVLDRHASARESRDAPVNRRAYEHLHTFCDLVEDLIFAGLPRFRELGGEEGGWSGFRYCILSENQREGHPNALLQSLEQAEAFTSEILWDGFEMLTRYFRLMRERLEEFSISWGTKPVFCSLEVASLFLDMETMLNFLKPRPSNNDAGDEKGRKILMAHRVVPQIGWEARPEGIFIGAEERLPQKLATAPESFGILQGLVWELTVPLNPDHLEDTPFKEFLNTADYLDFPGVERGATTSEESKVNLDITARMHARGQMIPPEDAGEETVRSCPMRFFTSILKRGKTSSIVQTYARQLTIDAFNIFQDMDGDKPNGDQLITGIRSWWRSCAPDYFSLRKGTSPLPLNLVLLWWAKFINEGHSLQDRQVVYKSLGEIADPEVSTTFAMNYYGIRPRGHLFAEKAAELPKIIERIKSEEAYRKQFRNETSRRSLDAMFSDRSTGGTDFFFTQLREQLASEHRDRRGRLLEEKKNECDRALRELLSHPDLIPNPQPLDNRREVMTAFRDRFFERLAEAREDQVRQMNWALRSALNVHHHDLHPVNRAPSRVKVDDIRNQFEHWISHQLDRYMEWQNASEGPQLGMIGLDDADTFREFLDALVRSLEPDLMEIAGWLRRLLQYLVNLGDSTTDVRRFLAVRMGNAIVFGPAGPRISLEDDFEEALTENDAAGLAQEPIGERCLSYRFFLQPFMGEGGHLEFLAHREIRAVSRPEQPGDPEIAALADAVGLVFKSGQIVEGGAS